jgi:uncharacterized protein YhbP (UPF0306 family)
MDKRIQDFISNQSVFSLCTSRDNVPYSAICVYAYLKEINALVFSSEENTRHITEALINPQISGTILPEKIELINAKGVQFTGVLSTKPDENKLSDAKKIYYAKYPFALLKKGRLWLVHIHSVKMTDNSLGFGTKLLWEHGK